MDSIVGRPLDRVDGRAKVTGKATYAAEWQLPGLVHAVLVPATVAPGRLAKLDVEAAKRAPGVIAVITHHDAGYFWPGKEAVLAATKLRMLELVPDPLVVMQDDLVRYVGQPIAVVVAETLQEAQHAATLIEAEVTREHTPRTDLEASAGLAYKPHAVNFDKPDATRGDMVAGWKDAEVKVEGTYVTAAESHNPMEPHATIAHWEDDGRVTVYDATQYVYGVKQMTAALFGMLPQHVHVVSHFVGGAFGSKGIAWPHVPLTVLAAKLVKRPVKLVLARRQMFGMIGFRPRTHQVLALGARKDGTLTALSHDVMAQTSTFGEYADGSGIISKVTYACPNVKVSHRVVPLDTQTPTFQRAPGEATGSFALESAMDELAYALGMDPLALRYHNYAERDPEEDKPFSSKSLRECYRLGAEKFGWDARTPAPGSMRHGRWLVGYGMATSSYPTNRSGASAQVVLTAQGGAIARSATHDLGTGTYTIMTQVAAEALGLPAGRVRFELGDSDYPEAPVAGGSQSAASVSNAVHEAALAVTLKLAQLAVKQPDSPLHGLDPKRVGMKGGHAVGLDAPEKGEPFEKILHRAGLATLEAEAESKPGDEAKKYSSHAWGAQFAEVWVDPDTRVIRLHRLVGAFAAGRILNAKTAHSQLMGGMVMGVGMGLLEEVTRDRHQGRVVNGSLEGYAVPVNADIQGLEVFIVPEEDPYVNPLGVKGLGELGIVGTGGAIANAVYHATGKRIRHLPIQLDDLL